MVTTTRVEKRQRGFFGWVFLVLFWLFNLLMAASLISGLAATADLNAGLASEAEQAGAAIGAALGLGLVLSIWAAGAIVLGLMVFLTRGRKVVIETVG